MLSQLQSCRTVPAVCPRRDPAGRIARELEERAGPSDSAAEPTVVPVVSVSVPMFTAGGRGEAHFAVGLLPVVEGWYAARGVNISIPNPLPALSPPAPAAAWQIGVSDPVLLDAVCTRPGVLVRYDPAHVDPVRLAAQIALAWPGIRIVVACSRKDEVRRVVAHLRSVAVPATGAYGSGELWPEELTAGVRVWVATYRGVSAPYVDARRADLVVLLNAREALGQLPSERVLGDCHGRVAGLLPEHEPLSVYERDMLWVLTGMPPLVIPRHGLVRRSVRVVHVKNDAPVVPPDRAGLDLLRQGVWRHHARNRRLARLVGLLKAGRLEELANSYPAVATALVGRPVGRVIVLTAVVEHAEALAGLIPDAALFTSPTPPTSAAPPAEMDGTMAGTGSMIVTPDALGVMVG